MSRLGVIRLLQRLDRLGFTKDTVLMDVGQHHMIAGLLCTQFKTWNDEFTRAQLHDFFVRNIYAFDNEKDERPLLEALERCLLCCDDPAVIEQRRLIEEEQAKDRKRREREELEAETLACERQLQEVQERLERLKRRSAFIL